MAAIPRYSATPTSPLLSAGFRPFFLSAGLWACIAMMLWVAMLRGLFALPTAFNPVAWHYHEFLFGFVTAAISGFLLTAIPNWTGRMPLSGRPLAFLVLLWWAGRAAVAVSASIGAVAAAVIDVAFLVVFAGVVAREILAGRNWRNLPVLAVLTLLGIANALSHTEGEWQEAGKRLAIGVVVLLISLIGGRIIPSFTTNWLRRRAADTLPASFGRFDLATIAATAAAVILWVVVEAHVATGIALVGAAVLQASRLVRWRGVATLEEPLLSVLHLGYLWVPIGLAMLGAGIVWPQIAGSMPIHALTVGAMATMILAVMTRASLGHSARPLTAGRGTTLVYAFITLAALTRVGAPLAPAAYDALLDAAAVLWTAAFALFVVLYAPLFLRR